jgi:hypothetical protein
MDSEKKRKTDKSKTSNITISIDEFICPITKEIFRKPALASDGFHYEECILQKLLSSSDPVSPITREPLIKRYIPDFQFERILNETLKNTIYDEKRFMTTDYLEYEYVKMDYKKHLFNKQYEKILEIKNVELTDTLRDGQSIMGFISKNVKDLETFKNLLSNAESINVVNAHGDTLIHILVKLNLDFSIEAVNYLLTLDKISYLISGRHGHAIKIALENKNEQLIKLLYDDILKKNRIDIFLEYSVNSLILGYFENDDIEKYLEIIVNFINDPKNYELIINSHFVNFKAEHTTASIESLDSNNNLTIKQKKKLMCWFIQLIYSVQVL